MKSRQSIAGVAWLLAAIYYFYQYALRSAPAVMIPQLSSAFGMTAVGVASLAGVFYYGYGPFSLVAGAAIDRMGAKVVASLGALVTAAGALLFVTGGVATANLGRFLQGAGGAFAMVAAIYIATKNFPASRAATLTGLAQAFGMAGGSAGQFAVGPMIAAGIPWTGFWSGMAAAGVLLAIALFVAIPRAPATNRSNEWMKSTSAAFWIVSKNPQSILSGLIGGLLFLPTNILAMTWGVSFLQGVHGFDYGESVLRSASVPVGWIIGCPLLGWLSDRLGRRKPVMFAGSILLLACLAWALYGHAELLPPYVVGIAAGIGSGAAMIPYSVIKESNPPDLSGTSTGWISFVIFTFSAVLGPVFGWIMQSASGGGEIGAAQYQTTFTPMLYGVALAIVLIFGLKETGPAVHTSSLAATAA
jgi:MFS family permease